MERDRAHRTESGLENPSGRVLTSSNVFSRRRIWRMVLVACRDLEASWEIRILRDWCFMSSCGSHRSPNLAVSLSAAALLTCCTLLIPITTTSTRHPPQHTQTHKHNGSRKQPPPILENTPKLLTKFQLRIQNSMKQLLIQIEPTQTSIHSVWVHNAAYLVLGILGAACQSGNNNWAKNQNETKQNKKKTGMIIVLWQVLEWVKATDTNKRKQSTKPQTARDKKSAKAREIGLRIDRKLQRRSGDGGGVRSLYAATVSRVVQRLQGNPVDPGSVGRPRVSTTLPTEEELFMDEKHPKLI